MAYESLADRYREIENDINPSQGTTGGGTSNVPLDEQSPDIIVITEYLRVHIDRDLYGRRTLK